MMSTAIAPSATATLDASESASPTAAPSAAGVGGFASALEALFAEGSAPTPQPVATVPVGDGSTTEAAGPPEANAALAEALPTMPDPLALLGLAPAPAAAPPVEPLQWLRLAVDRAARPVSAPVAPLAADAVPAPETAAVAPGPTEPELLAAAAASAGTPAAPALLPLDTANAASASEPRASEALAAESKAPDAPAALLGTENPAAHRSAHETGSRATPPPVTVPLQSPDWGREFSARVSWMVERGEQLASIRLSPEELGPVEVRLAIREGEASIWFGAAQADTRAAIEQALPRLREMLAASGLALADAGVFQGSPRDPRHGLVRADARRAAGESSEPVVESHTRYGRRGLIDDYA